MNPVPGFEALPLALRLRVHALSVLQRSADRHPELSARALAACPDSLQHLARRVAAPIRLRTPSPRAVLDVESTTRALAGARIVRTGAPRATIVIPTHGAVDWLGCCLAALAAHTPRLSFEVCVVDDASPDYGELREVLEPHDVELLRNPRNLGFAASVNRGARRARGDVLCVLNDDVIVTPGWLERLIAALDHDPELGLAGPCCNDTGDVATIDAAYSSLEQLLEFAVQRSGSPRSVAKLSLACAAVPRAAFEDVGGLDEGYGRGMFEDDDLCMRLHASGRSVALARDAFVHHAAGATFRKLDSFEYLARFEVNRRRFEQRWHVRWPVDDTRG